MKLHGNFLNATEVVKKFRHSPVVMSQKKLAICGVKTSAKVQEM